MKTTAKSIRNRFLSYCADGFIEGRSRIHYIFQRLSLLFGIAKTLIITKRRYRVSHWNIGTKLILIISCIIFTTLGSMIYLASYFFREIYELRIQEQNIKLAEIIGTNLEYTLSGFMQQGRLVVQNPLLKSSLNKTSQRGIIYAGLYKRGVLGLEAVRQFSNQTYLEKNNLSHAKFGKVVSRFEKYFQQSLRGATILTNVSPSFKMSIIGLSFPSESYANKKMILVIFFPMQIFLDFFHSENSGLIQNFIVDSDGKVLAHPNKELVQSGADLSNIAIISSMQKSRFSSGQKKYQDEKKNKYLGSFWKSSTLRFGVVSTVPEKEAFAGVYDIQRRNIYLMLTAVNLAILAVFLYSRRLTNPIKKLTAATRNIAKGKYEVTLQPQSGDEIGLLTSTFRTMSQGLQERENLKEAFGRFVNKEIAERSLKGQLKLGGEQRSVALLFSDIRNFTSMSEKLTPRDVVAFLNGYFGEMVECITQNMGTVDKFIGDAIMAHWSALYKQKDPVEKAIKAALAMRETLLIYNRKRRTGKRSNIHFGIGINYGPAVAGQIGSKERVEYTVIGDTVNVASRVEGLTKEFGVDIIVTQNAVKQISRRVFSFESLGSVNVKGKKKAIQIYALLGLKNNSNTPSDVKMLRKKIGIEYSTKKKLSLK